MRGKVKSLKKGGNEEMSRRFRRIKWGKRESTRKSKIKRRK